MITTTRLNGLFADELGSARVIDAPMAAPSPAVAQASKRSAGALMTWPLLVLVPLSMLLSSQQAPLDGDGDCLGAVGNSGNTGEPHLHVHAQRPGRAGAPLSGDPLPVLFAGRFPVRGDRIELP